MNKDNSNSNIFTSSKKKVYNSNELFKLIKEYEALIKEYENLPKYERIHLKEKITNIENILRYGLEINSTLVHQNISFVKEFVEIFGIDFNIFTKHLNSIKLTISPVNLLSKGRLCNYGSYISIDYSYANFDSEGNFVDFNEPEENFFKHTIIHELLHAISNKGFNYMDSFSEGMTEYFAHKISKATNIVSSSYEYIERIFYMFGTLMGDDLLFDDYVTNIYEMKNLKKFTNALGISEQEFKNFKIELDNFLTSNFDSKNTIEDLNLLKNKINKFIYERIILPYCSFDKVLAEKLVEQFFSKDDYYKMDLCEIHFSSNEKKVKN